MTDGLMSGQLRGAISTATTHLSQLMAMFIGCLVCVSVSAQEPGDFNYMPAVPTPDAEQGLFLGIAAAGSRVVAVGERGYIVYSDDGGKTWTQASVPISQTLTAVHFASDQIGWAVGHEGIILRTDDGGTTWSLQLTGYDASRLGLVVAEERLERARAELEQAERDGTGNIDDLEYAVEDAQIALESIQMAIEEGPSNPFLDVWFADEKIGFAVGSYGMIFRTGDGGETWQAWGGHISNPEGFHFYSLTRASRGTLFLAGEQGLLYRSRDLGEQWERLDSPYEGSLFGVVAGEGTGDEYVLIFGLRGNLFRSTDDGDSWAAVPSGTDLSIFGGTRLDDGSLTLVGNSGVVLRSVDGGLTFSKFIRPNRQPNSAVVENGSGDLVMVGRGGVKIVTVDGKDAKGG
jgi:photosystem II stability/assembly factor-like uncharacterized protein